MTTAQEIGSILKSKRKSKNLTQKQMAILAFDDEKQQCLISRIESGQYKSVGFEDINSVLKGLGFDLIELITETIKKPS